MALTYADQLLGPPRVSGVMVEQLISQLNDPDDKDIAFLRALRRWCAVAGIDDGDAYAQWLVETANGESLRWNRDLNPGGVGIPADSTVQPFLIGSADEAARILVQCIYTAVRRRLHPEVPVPGNAQSWFAGVWLPKVQHPGFPAVREVGDLNIRYEANGDSHATWAWDAGYIDALIDRANRFLPDLPDQKGAAVAIPPTPDVPKPVIYDLATDYARFGLTKWQADEILDHRFDNRNGGRPEFIVLHIQDGTTRGSLEYWVGVEASSHVMVQKDGSILRVIPDQHGAWTNGDVNRPSAEAMALIALGGNANNWSLTIEAEGGPWDQLTPAQKAAIVWQVQTWMIENPRIAARYLAGILRHGFINTVNKINCGLYRPEIAAAIDAWVTAAPVVPKPEPEPVPMPLYPPGMSPQLARELYEAQGKFTASWTSKAIGWDENRSECQAWLVWGKAALDAGEPYDARDEHGRPKADWPALVKIIRRGKTKNVHAYVYSNGAVYEKVVRTADQVMPAGGNS